MDAYWLTNADAPGIIIWILLVYLWWSGGWQLATHAFNLDRRERLLSDLYCCSCMQLSA